MIHFGWRQKTFISVSNCVNTILLFVISFSQKSKIDWWWLDVGDVDQFDLIDCYQPLQRQINVKSISLF